MLKATTHATITKVCASYNVGLKVLLKNKDGEFLFLTCGDNNCFDLPGGRIDDIEHNIALTSIIAREIQEELGQDVCYKLGKPLFQFRRHFENKGLHIFITVYEAEYMSGAVQLSDEHTNYTWIHPKKVALKEENFLNKEEYLAFKNYFENLENI